MEIRDKYGHERNRSYIWKDITTEAAITKLMYLLQQDIALRSLNYFETLRGDIIMRIYFESQFF
jgi:hypothetical protein